MPMYNINIEIMVLLKFLSNFGRTLEMLLINCKVNLILTCLQIALMLQIKSLHSQ